MSNIFSIKNIFDHLGFQVNLSSLPEDIIKADALVIPGVGAFGQAMTNLATLNLLEPIKAFIHSGKPFLGICLGLQLLFTKSYEFGVHPGLNLIEGDVIKFPAEIAGNNMRIPNVGWNSISQNRNWQHTPLEKLKNNEFLYFVHSYYVKPREEKYILSTSQFGDLNYCSSLIKDNIFATQYHPEKSGEVGLVILNNWIQQIR
ncbi:MAG: imidazole glycerol phosphate synthase subunit HisH [Gammaproteobacteria bacterium]|nr:imidazole glycerol phosphate synthase subunit HisH [Gammaproteobacteria bacterium]